MGKKRIIYISAGLGTLLLVAALLAWSGHRTAGSIVLPAVQGDTTGVEDPGGENRLHVVAISPETVGMAVATLSRPASYSRTQVVETFWSGGSGQSVTQASVSGGRTRLDTQQAGGSVRHTLLSGSAAAVWYDDEKTWTRLRAGEAAADLAARMLTYEAVLALPAEEIAAADYREREGVYCIYVETRQDAAGYVTCYWIGVENGLLWAAERSWNGALVYRFTAGQTAAEPPEESLFLLPDGSALE